MCKELKTPCKENTFYQKLKAIPELKFPEPSDQVKCGDCVNLKENTDKATTSAERLLYQQEHTAHVKFVDIERKAYYERMEICKTSEGRKKLIIADGMDQTKTNMPHVHQKNKTTEGKQLNTHVFGVTIHGNGTRIFIDYNQLPHDSNYVINAIMIALKEKIKSLGPDLYIQLDNTTGQNKNQFVHGFFYLTVHLKIFRYVEINGLPVGGKMKVLYPAGFLDVKQRLTPYLAKMFDVTTANCFRFRMLNNQVIYESRPNSQVPVWTEVGSLLKSIPRGNPKTVKIDNSPLKKFSKKN